MGYHNMRKHYRGSGLWSYGDIGLNIGGLWGRVMRLWGYGATGLQSYRVGYMVGVRVRFWTNRIMRFRVHLTLEALHNKL